MTVSRYRDVRVQSNVPQAFFCCSEKALRAAVATRLVQTNRGLEESCGRLPAPHEAEALACMRLRQGRFTGGELHAIAGLPCGSGGPGRQAIGNRPQVADLSHGASAGNLFRQPDDLLLNGVLDELGLVVNAQLAHEVELMSLNRFDAEVEL